MSSTYKIECMHAGTQQADFFGRAKWMLLVFVLFAK